MPTELDKQPPKDSEKEKQAPKDSEKEKQAPKDSEKEKEPAKEISPKPSTSRTFAPPKGIRKIDANLAHYIFQWAFLSGLPPGNERLSKTDAKEIIASTAFSARYMKWKKAYLTGKEPDLEELHGNIPSTGHEVEYMDEPGIAVADLDDAILDLEWSDRDEDDDLTFGRKMTNVVPTSSSDSTSVETTIKRKEVNKLIDDQETSAKHSPEGYESESQIPESSDNDTSSDEEEGSSDDADDSKEPGAIKVNWDDPKVKCFKLAFDNTNKQNSRSLS